MSRIRKAQRDEGFTLIELLIVIVILGILAAIVVFALGSTRKDSVASACKTDFKSVELSAEAIKTKTGKYPTATSLNDASTEASNSLLTGSTAGSATPSNGALLKAYPKNKDYRLEYAGVSTGASYTLTVQEPDAAGTGWENAVEIADATPATAVGAAAASAKVDACEALN